jgi:hypothetical protein
MRVRINATAIRIYAPIFISRPAPRYSDLIGHEHRVNDNRSHDSYGARYGLHLSCLHKRGLVG